MNSLSIRIFFISTFALSVNYVNSAILLVNSSSMGNGVRLTTVSSSNWNTNAYSNLQNAIDSAISGDEIWVKAGTYHPTRNPFTTTVVANDVRNVFLLKSNVQLYGGFAGNETTRNTRNVTQNITKLSADYANNDTPSITNPFNFGLQLNIKNNTENAVHCVLIPARMNVVLDGFSIEGGKASLSLNDSIDGVKVDHRYGGGIYILNSQRVVIANCKFKANLLNIRVERSDSINLTNNTYTLNTSAIHNKETNRLHLTNEKFYENLYTAYDGRLLPNQYGTITHSTFEYNILGEPGLIYLGEGHLDIKKTVFQFQNRSSNTVSYPHVIWAVGTLSVDSCKFYNNSTYFGSCINSSNNIELKNSVFRNNSGESNHFGSDVEISYDGIVRNCIFENTGLGSSSAVHFSNLRDTIINSVFKNSRLTIKDADLWIYNSTFFTTILNNVLSRINSGDTFTVVNSILWKKNTSSFPFSYTSSTSKNFQITNSNVSGPTILPGSGNYNIYPEFIDTSKTNIFGKDSLYFTEDDDLALKITSPSINSGINLSYPSKDILNKPRTIGCKTDHGAYENGGGSKIAGKDTSICKFMQLNIGSSPLAGYTYQWSGADIIGSSTTSNIIVKPNTSGIRQYTVSATNTSQNCVILDTVSISVNDYPTLTPNLDRSICNGDSILLNAIVSGSYDTIIWNIPSFVNNNFYKPNSSSQLIVTAIKSNCQSSDTMLVTLIPSTSIIRQPTSLTLCLNSADNINVSSSSPSDSFVWYKNGIEILNSNNDTLQILMANSQHIGNYYVKVIGRCNTLNSNSVSINLRDSIKANAFTYTVDSICTGKSYLKSLVVSGYNLSYQWKRDYINISGANSNSINLPNIAMKDSGVYHLLVSDGCSQFVNFNVGKLIAKQTIFPTISIKTPSILFCNSGNVTVSLLSSNIGVNPTISWRLNNNQISSSFGNLVFSPNHNDKLKAIVTLAENCASPNPLTSNELIFRISSSSSDTTFKTICLGASYSFEGNTYNATGLYNVKLKNHIGCDSIKYLKLEVNKMNNTILKTGIVLKANESNASYQWYDCSNNNLISGETNQSFTPKFTGLFKVRVMKNGCLIESSCMEAVLASITNSKSIEFLYPNPASNKIYINSGQSNNYNYEIWSIDGQKKAHGHCISEIDIKLLSTGIYHILLIDPIGNQIREKIQIIR